jgi:diguanylate cyclase (GGDEF)-like protein
MSLMPKAVAGHNTNVVSAFSADVRMAKGLAMLAEGGVDLAGLTVAADGSGRRLPGASWFIRVLDQLPACVYMTDAQGLVTYANRYATQLVGREPRIGEDRFTIAHRLFTIDGISVPDASSPMAITLRDATPIRGVEMLLERPDGVRVPVMPLPTPLFDADGALCGGFTLLIDISARKQAEQRLAESYRRDSLTGLPNRPALSAHLEECIARARHGGESFLTMRLDLDAFKALNDAYGHSVGDAVLIEAARRLRSALGEVFLARTGGDEFMVVSRSTQSGSEAHLLARQVRSAFDAEFLCGEHSFSISVSTGCARYPQDGDDETRLVAAANAALKLAKAEGPGTMRMFDIAEQAREQERQNFRRDLREAIEAKAITPHYQPLFRADGSIAGFEALARWDDQIRGLVAPAAFIAAAEEEGELIAALDSYILRSACIEAARWTQPLRIAVNVSALEFQSGDLPARVEAVLAETGLDPERLELEITEGVMVTDADRAMATFARLRALGVRIALDDFGTGYSSLSYLHRFPLTTLKIDRSFVAKLGVTLESVAITRAIIQLGHALGIEVVAEGVETPEQLDFLIQEGCDLTQGFLLGRPQKASAYAHVTGA